MLRVFSLIACLVLSTLLPVFPAPPTLPINQPFGLATVSTPHGFTIYCEIADTPAKISKGLMYRTKMAPDQGMLFTFPEPGYWEFWMKNTRMPLDILWLDRKGKVVHLESYVPICERTDNLCPLYRPKTAAVYVLELRAGQASALELVPGTQLTIEMPK